jgi:MOSC domain-containing protein YiiM
MDQLPHAREVEIVLLLASPTSRYEGRPSDGPLPAVGVEVRESIEIRAGLGVVGDRYFGKPAHVRASVTLMAAEVFDLVAGDLDIPHTLDMAAARRNIVLRGVDVDAMRGQIFSLDTGSGAVVFRANRPANPCAWMDVVLAPGANRALRGRGGMRCEPLSDGLLRVGPATLRSELPVADGVQPETLAGRSAEA